MIYDPVPVITAVKNNNVTALMALIAAGADVNVLCDRGCTPLHWACSRGLVECAYVLLAAGADVTARTMINGKLARELASDAEITMLLDSVGGGCATKVARS